MLKLVDYCGKIQRALCFTSWNLQTSLPVTPIDCRVFYTEHTSKMIKRTVIVITIFN